MGISEATHNKTALVNLGGKDYKMSAVTAHELGVIENEFKSAKIQQLRVVTDAAGLHGEDAANYILSKVSGMDIMAILTSDGATSMEMVGILSQVVYHGIKRNHADVKPENVLPFITLNNMMELSGKIKEVSENGENETKKAEAQAANP